MIRGLRFTYKGGPGDPGSGHHGHAGRPGEVGGSLPSKLPLVNNRGEEVRIEKVSKELGVAEITVMRKLTDLKQMGFLVTERRGKQVYYAKSGLFE